VILFFAFPEEVRKIIYTTNAIESLNASVRKAVRNKGAFPRRSGSHQADLAGASTHHRELETTADRVASCQGPTGHPVRRAVRAFKLINATGSHTALLTLPLNKLRVAIR